jgi:hypothetical protein
LVVVQAAVLVVLHPLVVVQAAVLVVLHPLVVVYRGNLSPFLSLFLTILSTEIIVHFYYQIRNANNSMDMRNNCSSIIIRLSLYIWCY